ncbi:hypothetical protein [Halodesulfovibrio sp.]|uniref:hypothetical protein n=1 Tax=Halodesulfovibrio sp. TaxID=1912772 RepID=UPI0025DFC2F5|nr:hypothetical protein [Halodesulfovibrio sp.]MCT4627276.1 hypothetical protein [Halodesulfovibrio sp.]
MPTTTPSTDLAEHLCNVLHPIQAYATILRQSNIEQMLFVGQVLDSVCLQAKADLQILTESLCTVVTIHHNQ